MLYSNGFLFSALLRRIRFRSNTLNPVLLSKASLPPLRVALSSYERFLCLQSSFSHSGLPGHKVKAKLSRFSWIDFAFTSQLVLSACSFKGGFRLPSMDSVLIQHGAHSQLHVPALNHLFQVTVFSLTISTLFQIIIL